MLRIACQFTLLILGCFWTTVTELNINGIHWFEKTGNLQSGLGLKVPFAGLCSISWTCLSTWDCFYFSCSEDPLGLIWSMLVREGGSVIAVSGIGEAYQTLISEWMNNTFIVSCICLSLVLHMSLYLNVLVFNPLVDINNIYLDSTSLFFLSFE